jgi:hypothetical protein
MLGELTETGFGPGAWMNKRLQDYTITFGNGCLDQA